MKHGLYYHRFYKKWLDARDRCTRAGSKDYESYGGRGLKMQANWINYPTDFIEYLEKLPNYFKGAELDRINNNIGYTEGNLRWATRTQQCKNRGLFKNSTSGYVGVTSKKGRWQVEADRIYVGLFDTIPEALSARNRFIIMNNLPNKIQTWRGM